ncbi:hypothetical protein RB201_22600 [Streptomyces sp. S1A(2023)]
MPVVTEFGADRVEHLGTDAGGAAARSAVRRRVGVVALREVVRRGRHRESGCPVA